MMKKWFIVPTLFLLASCCPNQESINRSRILYRDRVIEDIKIGTNSCSRSNEGIRIRRA